MNAIPANAVARRTIISFFPFNRAAHSLAVQRHRRRHSLIRRTNKTMIVRDAHGSRTATGDPLRKTSIGDYRRRRGTRAFLSSLNYAWPWALGNWLETGGVRVQNIAASAISDGKRAR
jgi:hypothetical protein